MLTTVAEINREFAVVFVSGSDYAILREYRDFTTKQIEFCFITKAGFNMYMANKYISIKRDGDEVIKEKAAKVWLASDKRREYSGLGFYPGKKIDEHYNIYRGLTCSPSKKGSCEKFKNHILENICSNDQRAYKYVLAWIADLFQNPGGKRPGVALVLRGEQGTGKGVFANQIGQILGQHYVHISNPAHLTGRFNNHLAKALLVFLDEAFAARDKTSQAVLKALITEDKQMLEAKGHDAIQVRNFSRIIIASNDQNIIKAGFEERRYCVLDVSSLHRQDSQYFKDVCDEMNNGGREAFLQEMLDYDIKGVNLRDFPKTEALLDQKLSSLNLSEQFWHNCLSEGRILYDKDWECAASEEIYNCFVAFVATIGLRYRPNQSRFFRELKQLCPPAERKKGSKQKNGKRQYCYYFPSLAECRRIFEEKIGSPINWGDEDEHDTS